MTSKRRCFHPQSLLRLPEGRRWVLRWVVNGATPEPPLFIPESWGFSPTALGRRILLPAQRQKASGIRDQTAMLRTRGCFRAGGKTLPKDKEEKCRESRAAQPCSLARKAPGEQQAPGPRKERPGSFSETRAQLRLFLHPGLRPVS